MHNVQHELCVPFCQEHASSLIPNLLSAGGSTHLGAHIHTCCVCPTLLSPTDARLQLATKLQTVPTIHSALSRQANTTKAKYSTRAWDFVYRTKLWSYRPNSHPNTVQALLYVLNLKLEIYISLHIYTGVTKGNLRYT